LGGTYWRHFGREGSGMRETHEGKNEKGKKSKKEEGSAEGFPFRRGGNQVGEGGLAESRKRRGRDGGIGQKRNVNGKKCEA